MSKDEILNLPDCDIPIVETNIVQTKQFFESLAHDTQEQIVAKMGDEEENPNPQEIIDLYNIFYESCVGLIRSGALCSRDTAFDGFPEITISAGDDTYKCREAVLVSILGQTASEVIKPYQDTFTGYFDMSEAYKVLPIKEEETVEENVKKKKPEKDSLNAEKELEEQAKKYKSMISEMEKKHSNEIAAVKSQYESALEESKKALMDASSSDNGPSQIIGDPQDKIQINADKAEIKNLTDKNNEIMNELKDKDIALARCQSKIADYENMEKERREDDERYEYNPDYDHYYNDDLPAIVKSLEFTHTDIVIKGIAAAVCCFGIFLSCLFII
jgi:hypothetical protein